MNQPTDRLFDLLTKMTEQLFNRPTDYLTNWLLDQLTERMLVNRQSNWLTVSLTAMCVPNLAANQKIDWQSVLLTDWLTDWVNDRTGLFTQMIFLQDNSDWVILFFFLVLLFVLFFFFLQTREKIKIFNASKVTFGYRSCPWRTHFWRGHKTVSS